jgi:hypothetical protein
VVVCYSSTQRLYLLLKAIFGAAFGRTMKVSLFRMLHKVINYNTIVTSKLTFHSKMNDTRWSEWEIAEKGEI